MKLIGCAINVHGTNVYQFSGEAVRILRQTVIRKYGKSTKRITKKRVKAYLMKLLLDAAKRDIDEHSKVRNVTL